MSISVSIISYNEEKNIQRALDSAAWADDIVLIDCNSSDATCKIAEKSKARIFKRENSLAVYVNKQFAIEQCYGDWIFVLDADEEISPELASELKIISMNPQGKVAFRLPRKNFYFGKWLKHGGKYPDIQLRFFKKNFAKFKPLVVHEYLEVTGPVGKLKNPLLHYPCQDTEDFLKKLPFYTEVLSQNYINKRKNDISVIMRPFLKFFTNYILKLGFLDGSAGFKTAIMDFIVICSAINRFFEKKRKISSSFPTRIV